MTNEQRAYLEAYLDNVIGQQRVQWMENYIQHGTVTCLEHCIAVAEASYAFACRFKIKVDVKSLVRGALLHDYFLYDWHHKDKGVRWHGFRHPAIALKNARRDFDLSWIEVDIIRKHMWPLTLFPPLCREAYIVCLMDKYCSIKETAAGLKLKFIRLW